MLCLFIRLLKRHQMASMRDSHFSFRCFFLLNINSTKNKTIQFLIPFSQFLFKWLVSSDNANSFQDELVKGGREEKDATNAPVTTDNIDVLDATTTTTEHVWTADDASLTESVSLPGETSTRNASDARGIFSNMVKTINKCKSYPIIYSNSLFICSFLKRWWTVKEKERKTNFVCYLIR